MVSKGTQNKTGDSRRNFPHFTASQVFNYTGFEFSNERANNSTAHETHANNNTIHKTQNSTRTMTIEPLELDWNAYVQQCAEDLMRSPDPWNKKETIWSLQTAACTYAGLGVRESNKKFPEATRHYSVHTTRTERLRHPTAAVLLY